VSQVVTSLVSVVVGALLTAGLQHLVWNRQQQASEEREKRRERARAVERFRDIGSLVIELSRATLSGSSIEKTQLATATMLENERLRRELVAAIAAVRDAYPFQQTLLTNLQEKIIQRDLSKSPLQIYSLSFVRSRPICLQSVNATIWPQKQAARAPAPKILWPHQNCACTNY